MGRLRSFTCSIFLAALTIGLGQSALASANCAAPVSYDIAVNENTVTITPTNESHRGCPAPDGLLRENVNTGEIVRVPDLCGPERMYAAENRAFIDECVPAGKYRYGFAEPYECVSYACGTFRFAEASVSKPLGDCRREHPDSVPSTVSSVPWRQGELICSYPSEDDGGCTALPRGGRTVLTLDLSMCSLACMVLMLRWLRRGRR